MSGQPSWAHAVASGQWVKAPVRCIAQRADGMGGHHVLPGQPVPLAALASAQVVDATTLLPTGALVVNPADRSTWEDLERVPDHAAALRQGGWASTVAMY